MNEIDRYLVSKRYKAMREKDPDSIFLFKIWDFYETFYQNALTLHKVLDLSLTKIEWKNDSVPMTGFPCSLLHHNLDKLIRSGFRVVVIKKEKNKEKDIEEEGKT